MSIRSSLSKKCIQRSTTSIKYLHNRKWAKYSIRYFLIANRNSWQNLWRSWWHNRWNHKNYRSVINVDKSYINWSVFICWNINSKSINISVSLLSGIRTKMVYYRDIRWLVVFKDLLSNIMIDADLSQNMLKNLRRHL